MVTPNVVRSMAIGSEVTFSHMFHPPNLPSRQAEQDCSFTSLDINCVEHLSQQLTDSRLLKSLAQVAVRHAAKMIFKVVVALEARVC